MRAGERLGRRLDARPDARGRLGARQDMALVLVLAQIVGGDRRPRGCAPRSPTPRARKRRSLRGSSARRRGCDAAPARSSPRGSSPGPCRRSRSAGSSGSRGGRARRPRAPGRRESSTPTNGAVARPSSRRKFFSTSRSWVSASARAPGRTGLRALKKLDAGDRHVLEFVGDDIDRFGEARERRLVVERGDGARARRVVGRRVALGRVDVAAQAELQRGHRQHAAELAGAENADRGAGSEDHPAPPSDGRFGDRRRVRAARQASSRSASAASLSASTAAASSAALTAPGLRRSPACRPARPPASARSTAGCPGRTAPCVSIGTPNTGSVVNAAVMPGRCAAPPAPAMITLKPAASRALGEGDQPVGRAMRRDDARVVADAELVERLGGAPHRRPVGLAAHDDRDGFGGDAHGRLPGGERLENMRAAIRQGRGRRKAGAGRRQRAAHRRSEPKCQRA